MSDNGELGVDDYIKALERMKKSPRDRVGVLGEVGSTSLGAVAGLGAAGTIASVAGVSTLFGSSALGSILGGVLVASTPVGWVLGVAAVGGAVGYGASKMVRGGGRSDEIKKINISELDKTINQMRSAAHVEKDHNKKMERLLDCMQLVVGKGKLSPKDSFDLLKGVENKKLTIDFVFETLHQL